MSTGQTIVRLSFAFAFLAAACWVIFGRMGISYRLMGHGFEVRLFGLIPLWRARYQDISCVERYQPSLKNLGFGAVALSNRRSFKGMVRIWKKKGFARSAIITPDDPDGFISSLSDLIRR